MMRNFVLLVLTLFSIGETADPESDGWIKTTLGDKKVEFDLENEALEIKTDSAAGSREFVHISVFSDSESLMGSIGIQWTITGLDPTYTLGYCLDVDAPFSKSLPAGDEKIWRITISKTAEDIEFTIHCNDEEMASVKFSEVCNLDGWKSKWVDNGKLQKIQFTRFSVAADYYRAYKPDNAEDDVKEDDVKEDDVKDDEDDCKTTYTCLNGSITVAAKHLLMFPSLLVASLIAGLF